VAKLDTNRPDVLKFGFQRLAASNNHRQEVSSNLQSISQCESIIVTLRSNNYIYT